MSPAEVLSHRLWSRSVPQGRHSLQQHYFHLILLQSPHPLCRRCLRICPTRRQCLIKHRNLTRVLESMLVPRGPMLPSLFHATSATSTIIPSDRLYTFDILSVKFVSHRDLKAGSSIFYIRYQLIETPTACCINICILKYCTLILQHYFWFKINDGDPKWSPVSIPPDDLSFPITGVVSISVNTVDILPCTRKVCDLGTCSVYGRVR